MNIESVWLICWCWKQNRDPTWYEMYPFMVLFPCIFILIRMVYPNITYDLCVRISMCWQLSYDICTSCELWIFGQTMVSACICTIYIFSVPVVPHKAVAEVSKIGNLQDRLVVVNHGWESKATDGPKGGWGLFSFSLFLSLSLTIYLPTHLSIYASIYLSLSLSLSLSCSAVWCN